VTPGSPQAQEALERLVLDSNKLMHFKAIAESESITQAAKKLFISQPALSKSLSMLEEELGCQLFNRIKRRIFINDNGRKLLKLVDEMEAVFKRIEDEFMLKEERVLSICGVGNFFSFILEDYLKGGMRPIKLQVVPDSEVAQLLLGGDSDVAIADDYYLKVVYKDGLSRIPILSEQLLLSVSSSHELAGCRSVRIEDLESEQIMRTTTSDETNNWLVKILELNNININWSATLDSHTWQHYMFNASEDMPPCFDSSSLYLNSTELQNAHRKRVLLKVEGVYTNRMIYLWYLDKNQEFLAEFLQCVRNIFAYENTDIQKKENGWI